jgi:hypothetical protein
MAGTWQEEWRLEVFSIRAEIWYDQTVLLFLPRTSYRPEEKPGSMLLPDRAKVEGVATSFAKNQRLRMEEKTTCPVSGNACVECGIFRSRHLHCSFFRANLEIDQSQEEILRRRRETEEELTAEGVWFINKSPKKSP